MFPDSQWLTQMKMTEICTICGCELHHTNDTYARPTPAGRSHASKHHFVPERFFGRSNTRKGTRRKRIFSICPWGHEGETTIVCYDCHEELLHNPVLLPEDIAAFAALVNERGLAESKKTESRTKIAGRIKLFHEVIRKGLKQSQKDSSSQPGTPLFRP